MTTPTPAADSGSETLFLTVEQVKIRLNLKRSTAYNIITSGEIPHIRIGRLIRVSKSALDAYIAEKLGEPPSEHHSAIALLTVPEVAKKLFLARSTAYNFVAEGKIPSIKIGPVIMVPSHWLPVGLNWQAGSYTGR